jgi:hypothetical protein
MAVGRLAGSLHRVLPARSEMGDHSDAPDLLAPISKSTTRTQSTCTNWSVGGISLVRRVPRQSAAGGESVSQSPLKDKAFSTLLEQNPPFELRPNPAFASNLFLESIEAHRLLATAQFPSAVNSKGLLAFVLQGHQAPNVRMSIECTAFNCADPARERQLCAK